MITQYVGSNGYYSTVDSNVQAVVSNKIALLDNYVLFQTGEYEYTALIQNSITKDTTQYKISRGSSYSGSYSITTTDNVDFDYSISNEMYVYSNVGQGRALELPVYKGVISYSLIIMCCAMLFAIVFKGVLFRCLDRKR